jgi:hypothetical protein
VNFPKVEEIRNNAFMDCISLTWENLPATLTTIEYGAFSGCTSFTAVSLPENLTSIGQGLFPGNPFAGCTGLTSITVDPANSAYKHSADGKMLLNKAGDTLIAYPSAKGDVTLTGITVIGGDAFAGCPLLTSVNLPDVTDIGDDAFWDYRENLTVTLGAAVPTLETGIFFFVRYDKIVTVKVPNDPAWSGKTGSWTTDTTADTWGNGFRGGGWDESGHMIDDSKVNSNITLTVEAYTP